jgi:hypothetical protein
MKQGIGLLVAGTFAALLSLSGAAQAESQAGGNTPIQLAACDPGDRIDGTTATETRRKIEAAGYSQVRDLMKGCDNYWHASAVKDGIRENVVVTPQGEVWPDGN